MIRYFLLCIKAYSEIEAICSKCEFETTFAGFLWVRTDEKKHISYQYQCQDCGKLKYSEEYNAKGNIVALSEKCECTGQYRRDKNIFCPDCNHRKTIENKTEDYLILSDNKLKYFNEIHGR